MARWTLLKPAFWVFASTILIGGCAGTPHTLALDGSVSKRPVFTLPNGALVSVRGRSLADMRFLRVERQTQDLSCGAAAVATVLRHFYGQDITEGELIRTIFETETPANRARIQKDGFSMLELKRHLERLGYVAGGFRLESIEDLRKLTVPAITLINIRGYNHFVVVKTLQDDIVLVADPAFGNLRIPVSTFQGQWSSVILVAVDPRAAPQLSFLQDPSARARPRELLSIRPLPGGQELKLPGEF